MTGKNDNEPECAFRPPTADANPSEPVFSTPEEGIAMMRVFSRIRNPAVREALIELASRLASDASN